MTCTVIKSLAAWVETYAGGADFGRMASPWVVERYGSEASATGLSNKSAAWRSDTGAETKSTYCPRFYARVDANSHARMYTQTQLCSVATGVMGPCSLRRECALWLQHLSSSIYILLLYTEHTQNTPKGTTVMNVLFFFLSKYSLICALQVHNSHPRCLSAGSFSILLNSDQAQKGSRLGSVPTAVSLASFHNQRAPLRAQSVRANIF